MVAGAFALFTAPVVAFARTSDNPKRRGARESTQVLVRYFSNGVGEREDAMEADKYEVLSFDCYGTLVDWESGIISGLRPVLRSHGVGGHGRRDPRPPRPDRAWAAGYLEEGAYLKYRDVL